MGAQFFFREWDGYVNQKNWGLDNLPFTAPMDIYSGCGRGDHA